MSFEHDALVYDGPDEFLEHMLPFVRGGLKREEGVLAVTSRRNLDALRDALGADAPLVDFRDSTEWYASPGKAFNAYAAYVSAHARERRLRVIGEPVWPVGSDAAVAEWARYESALNVAFADAPAWIVCPYDGSELPETIVEHARHTHPTLHDRGMRIVHRDYVDPSDFWTGLGGAALEPPPPQARRYDVTPELAALRARVGADAVAAGVCAVRIPELLLAVHELAINALTHGGGHGVAWTWVDGEHFVVELADHGPGLGDERQPGYRVPAPEEPRGRGLWLARQLCDYVTVRSDDGGARVRVRVRR